MENKEAMAVLIGGKEITVTKRDRSTEVVKVIDLAVEDLPKLAEVLANEIAQVELYCGKEEGWGRTLDNASHVLVIETGEEVNNAFFDAWLARSLKRAGRVTAPGVAAAAASVSPPTPPRRPANAV